MSFSGEPFGPNRPDVIDETFEGEAVIVNMTTGCYFALSPAATQLWALIADGRSAESLAASVDADPATVAEFLVRLREEDLVAPVAADAGAAAEQIALDGAPTLEKFTDMQALLMLDPIHDIDLDGDGWPVAPTA